MFHTDVNLLREQFKGTYPSWTTKTVPTMESIPSRALAYTDRGHCQLEWQNLDIVNFFRFFVIVDVWIVIVVHVSRVIRIFHLRIYGVHLF
jgi:hypothetical protein